MTQVQTLKLIGNFFFIFGRAPNQLKFIHSRIPLEHNYTYSEGNEVEVAYAQYGSLKDDTFPSSADKEIYYIKLFSLTATSDTEWSYGGSEGTAIVV